jgi:hypothetical protein
MVASVSTGGEERGIKDAREERRGDGRTMSVDDHRA